jgi:radical SAM superfamily enzyme YgiQ (UPF0313 family)
VGPVLENLDEQVFPAIERFSLNRYIPTPLNFQRLPTIGLMSSRGCPFSCTFCATHFQWNKKVRFMSRPLLVDWIQRLVSDFGIRDIRFYDDTFTLSKSKVIQFCEELLSRNIKIAWNCYSRVDTIDSEMAALMKRSGCYQVKFGIEAGTETSLRKIKKKISLKQAVKAINLVHSYHIESKASFMFGIHDETLQDSKSTLDFALELQPDLATFQIMMIHPGSEDFRTFRDAGRIPEDFNWDQPLLVSNLDRRDLSRLLDTAYRRFYIRIGFFVRLLKHFFYQPKSIFLRLAYLFKYVFRLLVDMFISIKKVEYGGNP